MKKFFFISLVVAFILSCGKDSLDFFIPNLSNNWENIADRDNEFFFFNYQDSANKSTFDGNENTGNGDQFQFAGSYENTGIEFTFLTGPRKDKTFRGNIDRNNPARMTIRSDSETLTLERQP